MCCQAPRQGVVLGMIDRDARDKAVALVQDYWTGKISNRDLEDFWPNSDDNGVKEIFQFMWTLYSDFKKHSVRKQDIENHELSSIVMNCINFLKSDNDYTWPHSPVVFSFEQYPRWAVFVSLGLLGCLNKWTASRERRYWIEMHAHGNVKAWPFTER